MAKKKPEAAVYYQPEAGPQGTIIKRGSLQVCDQYIRERKGKADAAERFYLINDKEDPRWNHR